jgi:uncharacterized protein (TIGR03435 family)
MMTRRIARELLISVVVSIAISPLAAFAQEATATTLTAAATSSASQSQDTVAKPMVFDVVSIRPAKPGARGGDLRLTQPDGYMATETIGITILLAYFPQRSWGRDRVQGAPAWVDQDSYEIAAKVSDADLPEWTRQNNLQPEQKVLFQQMLQSMLADRCKLAFHRVPGSVSGYELVLGKHPHLTASTPGAKLPPGMKLSDGGVMVDSPSGAAEEEMHFYNTTMAAFVEYLPRIAGGRVIDKTGLAGHYDFVLPWADQNSEHPGAIYPNDPDPLSHWDFNSLDLRTQNVKTPIDNLVIDHIERPSEN